MASILSRPQCVKHNIFVTCIVESGALFINTLRPIQNGRYFPDDIFKSMFLNENVRISIKNSLKFVLKGPINNIPALVQIMAWRRSGEKPLSEPMMVRLPTHICVAQPQWVKRTNVLPQDFMNSPSDMWKNLAFWGTSMKLGRMVPLVIANDFRYGATQVSPCGQNGGHLVDAITGK